jgi:hypothetical protein
MTTDTLEPALTSYDRRVLTAVPASGDDREWVTRVRQVDETATVWEIGQALNMLDLSEVTTILWSLQYLGYVRSAPSKSRKREVWWRTFKGDEALAA